MQSSGLFYRADAQHTLPHKTWDELKADHEAGKSAKKRKRKSDVVVDISEKPVRPKKKRKIVDKIEEIVQEKGEENSEEDDDFQEQP